MLNNFRPYTIGYTGKVDNRLITDRSQEEIDIVCQWIRKRLKKKKSPNNDITSYQLKHIFEDDTGIYLSNNEFKDAMLMCGYVPVDPDMSDWCFYISAASPALKTRKMNVERLASAVVIMSDVKKEPLEKVWKEEVSSYYKENFDFNEVREFIEKNYYPVTPAAKLAEELIRISGESMRGIKTVWENDIPKLAKEGIQYDDVRQWVFKKGDFGSTFEKEFWPSMTHD